MTTEIIHGTTSTWTFCTHRFQRIVKQGWFGKKVSFHCVKCMLKLKPKKLERLRKLGINFEIIK